MCHEMAAAVPDDSEQSKDPLQPAKWVVDSVEQRG